MERVVFESTDRLSRLEADTFAELADRSLQPVRMRYADLQEQIDSIGDVIVQEDILIERLPAQKRDHATLAKKIVSARAELAKLIPKGNEARAAALTTLETLCATAEAGVEALRRRRKTIEDLATAVTHQQTNVEPTRFAAMKQQFFNAQLTDAEWGSLRMKFSGDTAVAIDGARVRAAAAEKKALDEDPKAPIDRKQPPTDQWPLSVLIAERNRAREVVGIDAARQKKYSEGQELIAKDQVTLTRLDVQLEHAAGARARRKEHIALRRAHYVQIVEQLVQEETILETLYARCASVWNTPTARWPTSRLWFSAMLTSARGAREANNCSTCAPEHGLRATVLSATMPRNCCGRRGRPGHPKTSPRRWIFFATSCSKNSRTCRHGSIRMRGAPGTRT